MADFFKDLDRLCNLLEEGDVSFAEFKDRINGVHKDIMTYQDQEKNILRQSLKDEERRRKANKEKLKPDPIMMIGTVICILVSLFLFKKNPGASLLLMFMAVGFMFTSICQMINTQS